MDLTTRAILLLGFILALFVIAGLAVVIGRKMTGDVNGDEFDVGRNRTRRRKQPKAKAPKKAKTTKADGAAEMAASNSAMNAPLPPAYPVGNSVESGPPLPPVKTSATGPSPFGGAPAATEEEW